TLSLQNTQQVPLSLDALTIEDDEELRYDAAKFDLGLDVMEEDGVALPAADPDTLAYVLFTSGSTGRPKPVGVAHGPASLHIAGVSALYGLTAEDRLLSFSALTFDPWLEQLFAAFHVGASLAMRDPQPWSPAELARESRRMEVTFAFLPTAYWHQVTADPPAAAAFRRQVRLCVAGGEAMRPDAAAAWARLSGDGVLHNGYGPTETLVTAAVWPVDGEHAATAARSPIGPASRGRVLWVLDRGMRMAPAGVAEELYIGGELLARGYLGRPAITAAAFVPDPFSARPGARLYRTGDRVRWRDDGMLEFLGRVDQQVKVRGYRVEPGEIEVALRAHPAVRDAVVVALPDAAGLRLAGYVAAAADPALPAELRAHLRGVLPEYMVPASLTVLDALPISTASGKVDRRALPAPDAEEGAAWVAPSTETEQALAPLWEALLGAERVGAADDFFARGGHSLLAAQLVSRVREAFGVELPLRAVFEASTLSALAGRIDGLRGDTAGAAGGDIPLADRSRPIPLSFSQERLWFLEQLEPGSPVYNVPFGLTLEGPLDADALARAVDEIVRRHEVLRTAFEPGEAGPVQRILPPSGFRTEIVDLADVPESAREEEVGTRMVAEGRRPFDLRHGPMVRATIYRITPQRHGLMVVMHHAATDAWAGSVLFGELAALYEAFRRGEPSPLPALPLQYADFAAWQRGWLTGDELERQLAYWRGVLGGAPATLDLPYDRPRPAVQDLRGDTHGFALTPDAARAARELARASGATVFMVMVAAFSAVLRRWSGQDDLVIGTPIINRPRRELEPLIGFFSNTLPLRADLSGDPSFRALLGRVRETTLGAYAHQDVPFEKLVDELRVERSMSHSPLFQVMLTHQTAGRDGPTGLGEALMEPHAPELGTSRFDLTVGVVEAGDDIVGSVEYALALFDDATVGRMMEHLDVLLRAAGEDPQAPLSTL
ncbi:MAG TPA: condensation domain-containing protein, partial [Longimicrobium sp.]|nr:condensation domain-containing protein [Longimicrobium sp.]